MIRSGDTLHNPMTGEVIRFVKAAADTGGEYVLVEVVVEPNGAVAAAHVHPYQTEIFPATRPHVRAGTALRRLARPVAQRAHERSGLPAGPLSSRRGARR